MPSVSAIVTAGKLAGMPFLLHSTPAEAHMYASHGLRSLVRAKCRSDRDMLNEALCNTHCWHPAAELLEVTTMFCAQ